MFGQVIALTAISGRGRHSHPRRKRFRGSRWWYGDNLYMFAPSTKWNTTHHTERTCIGPFHSNNSARCGVRLMLVLAILAWATVCSSVERPMS